MSKDRSKWDQTYDMLLGLVAGMLLTALVLSLVQDIRDPIYRIEDCVMSIEDARTEDEVCTTWLDEDQNVVVGPLWLKGED